MHALEWLRRSDREPLRPIYVVSGDDVYLIRESIHAVSRAVFPEHGGETPSSTHAGSLASLADVLDDVSTVPFFAPRRLVAVEGADTFVTKYRQEIETYAGSPSATGVLLLQVKKWPSNTNLAKLIERVGLAVECSEPREGELGPWLIELARTRHGAALDADAAGLLVELVGTEAGILAAETSKLAVYAGDTRRIQRDDVIRLVGAGRVETIWKAVDAATTGRARAALELLNNVVAGGEDPIGMLAAISTTLLKLHHAGWLRAAHVDLEEACRIASIPSFALEKTRRQHAHLGPSRVDELPGTLLRTDLDLKGGSSLDPRVVLETFIVRLSLSRTD
jgi:DNA polymerase-3 subunit delta